MSEKIKAGAAGFASAAVLAVCFSAAAEPLGSEFDNQYGLEYNAASVERSEITSNDTLRDGVVKAANRGGARIQAAVEATYDALTR